jgi:hypothetical protein
MTTYPGLKVSILEAQGLFEGRPFLETASVSLIGAEAT